MYCGKEISNFINVAEPLLANWDPMSSQLLITSSMLLSKKKSRNIKQMCTPSKSDKNRRAFYLTLVLL